MSECTCVAPGFCPVYKKFMPEPWWRICRNDTTNLTPEYCAKYRALWLREADGQPPPQEPVEPKELVGNALKSLIEWFGVGGEEECPPCRDMRLKLNRWGADYCRKNIEQIVDHLESEAKARQIPTVRIALRALVSRAIVLAEKEFRERTNAA